MCTAMTFQTKCHYFGRTLDYNISFGETVTITPRQYPFHFRCLPPIPEHYAIIGMAKIERNYPL
ncbi:MAG: linear amide C-N hydrolase, partial [Clostridia bacterium]|nr:linear amide C-N hydrolase [Clostridia bacterium]